MRRLLVLLLIFALLAPALPAKAETSYYALQFDGEDDYMSTNYQFTGSFTIVWIGKIKSDEGRHYIFNNGKDAADASNSDGTWAYYYDGYIVFTVVEQNVSKREISYQFDKINQSVMITCVYDEATNTMKLYENTELKAQRTDAVLTPSGKTVTYFASYSSTLHNSAEDIYVILIYSRALSDTEIQAIYNDPLHPPQDGLVLWLAPDSVDTANNIWKDKSGNGNDGSIVGASYVPLRPVSESTPSQSSPYGLYFGGSGYVKIADSADMNFGDISIVALFKAETVDISQSIVFKYRSFQFSIDNYGKLWWGIWGSALRSNTVLQANKQYFAAITFDNSTYEAKWYVNGELDKSATLSKGIDETANPIYVGYKADAGTSFRGRIYLILIYNRVLSDEEIQAIYENPSNPPLDGLVLWYDPYSYDPETGKWLNRAPIFPTVPLVEELDGTNYGATAERVSIPEEHYIDMDTGAEIYVGNVSVELLEGDSKFSLIPSFLILPFNTSVTLNVSAINYESSLISFATPIDILNVYLEPVENGVVITEEEMLNATAPAEEFKAPDEARRVLNIFTKWLGGEYLIHLFDMDLDAMLADYFSNPPLPGLNILTALMLFVGASFATYAYFKEPEHAWIAGNLVYFGLMDYLPGFTPAIVFGPLALFNLYLGYQAFMKYAKKLGGR